MSEPGLYERIVARVVLDGRLHSTRLEPDLLIGQLPSSSGMVFVVRHGSTHDVGALIRAARKLGVQIAVVGGGPEAAAALKKAIPWLTGAGVAAWHVADDGSVTSVAGIVKRHGLGPLLRGEPVGLTKAGTAPG